MDQNNQDNKMDEILEAVKSIKDNSVSQESLNLIFPASLLRGLSKVTSVI